MEEKKNEKGAEGKHNKKNSSRRHGYFIEPSTESKSSEVKVAPSKGTSGAEQSPKRDNRNHSNQRRNKHHNKKGDNGVAVQTA